MNGETGEIDKAEDVADDVEATSEPEDTVVLADLDEADNIGDMSVEINVEELVAKLEATADDDVGRKHAIRERLEELREENEVELDSTFNFNLDEDL